MEKIVAIYRKEHFNAAHRLYHPGWSDERNREVFGKCSNPSYHGHNYELVVKLVGTPDPETGMLIDLKQLSELIQREVTERFDHRNLNLDTVEFKDLNPTVENIVYVIYHLLRPHIATDLRLQVRLYETERNFAEFPVNAQ